jgi:hypothetical protein
MIAAIVLGRAPVMARAVRARAAARALAMGALAMAGLAGCADEEPWVVRPPGGGGGGTGSGSNGGGDAGTDGGSGASGRLCVVDDLRRPDACAATADDDAVRIAVRGGVTVTTDAGGRFTLPAATAPRIVDFADGLPRTPSGKIRRAALRA